MILKVKVVENDEWIRIQIFINSILDKDDYKEEEVI